MRTELGRLMRVQRAYAGWSQLELAHHMSKALGKKLSQFRVWRLENGSAEPTQEELAVLLWRLDVSSLRERSGKRKRRQRN